MDPTVTHCRPRTASSRILFTNRLGNWFRRLLAYLMTSILEYFSPGLTGYREVPLSPISAARLSAVGRKTLVLDLDETLVHSCLADLSATRTGCPCQVSEHVVPDFLVNVDYIGGEMIPIRVFKRPHIDRFLRLVSKWYDLVIFTASIEAYANQVLDQLDGGRGMFTRRFYRQHCRADRLLTKDLTLIGTDMRGIFIIDNLPRAYMDFPNNALPIKSYLYDPEDTELLKLLPFLDALRFTKDVRSVLGRRVHR
ncbi:hypothetical protein KR032_011752 [Drosophila birchii]|nr:hypothetical protein KR032_011752 [Drosophila birchii]